MLEVVYFSDDQRQYPIGIWSWTSLCKTKPWWFHMERAHRSASGRRSQWMGAWGGAACLMKVAGTRMQDAAPCLYHWSQIVPPWGAGKRCSPALQWATSSFLFLGSQFLFSSSSTSKKRIFNNWVGRACYPEAMGGSGAAPQWHHAVCLAKPSSRQGYSVKHN